MKFKLLFLCTLFGILGGNAQNGRLKTEDDGFCWELVTIGEYRGANDQYGNVLIPASESVGFNWITYEHGFLCGVNTDINQFTSDFANIKNVIGYYTKEGKCIIEPRKYDHTSLEFDENNKIPPYFNILKDGLWGICDIDGKVILTPSSHSIPSYNDNGFEIKNDSEDYVQTSVKLRGHNSIDMADKRDFKESDGFEWTRLRNSDWKYGALSSDGSLLFPIEYDRIEYKPSKVIGKTGLFILHKNDAEGWYSAQGYCFVPVERGYTYISPCKYGDFARVDKGNEEYGIYHHLLGEVIKPGKYSDVYLDDDGFFSVESNNKYGAVDLEGNVLVAPIYQDRLSMNNNGIYYTDDNFDDVYVYRFVTEENEVEEIETTSQPDIWDNILGFATAVSNGISNINAVHAQNNTSTDTTPIKRNVSKTRRTASRNNNSVAASNNERNDRNTYNSYVSHLIDMNTYRGRYNDAQRRRIQSSMKSIRSKYNFPKSDWEDWDGTPR